MTQANVSKDAKKTAENSNEKPQKHGTRSIWILFIIGACILITTYSLTKVFETHELNEKKSNSVNLRTFEEFPEYMNQTLAMVAAETSLIGYLEEPCKVDCIDASSQRETQQNMFRMRCINLNSTATETKNPPSSNLIGSIISTEDSNSSSSGFSPPGENKPYLEKHIISIDDLEYLHFEPPTHEFKLLLFDNRSAQIIILDFHHDSPINIIWFSDEVESSNVSHAGETIDYNCDSYEEPFLLVDDLAPNTTYTFCLLPHLEVTISPFNCLPLYVPLAELDQDIWITQEEKQLTICLLCLVFAMSTLVGAGSAYWVFRNYPELLEGSKNVLVVKESDRSGYVSTISTNEYSQNSSIQKNAKVVLKGKDSIVANCSSTSFGSCIASTSILPQDECETTTLYENSPECTACCISNNYAPSPASPPPLPRRNSNL